MRPEKLKQLQEITWQTIQGKSYDAVKREVSTSNLLLKLDVKIDLENCFKVAKEKGIKDIKDADLLNNAEFVSAAQIHIFADKVTNVKDTNLEVLMASLDELLHMDIPSIAITDDIYNDKYINETWNKVK